MSRIKAVPTEYKGYLFRSRLEARWAVFFDALGIEWEYEPEGIVLSNGKSYLPDFYLVDFYCFFEVKSKAIKGTAKEKVAMSKISNGRRWAGMICFGDPMDDDIHIFCQETERSGGGGYESNITIGPHPDTHKPYLFSYDDRRERSFYTHFGEDMDDERIPMLTCEYGNYKYKDFVNANVEYARKLARQARFEYGDTPIVGRDRI